VQNSTCIEYSFEGDVEAQLAELRAQEDKSRIDHYNRIAAPGRSASWGERNQEIVGILSEARVDTFEYSMGGITFIGWGFEDIEKVENLLGYSEEEKAINKEIRDTYAEPNTPNK
jgi:hypothetical protein